MVQETHVNPQNFRKLQFTLIFLQLGRRRVRLNVKYRFYKENESVATLKYFSLQLL